MTTPGGVPNLPQGALTLDNLLQAAEKIQAADAPWVDDTIFCAVDTVGWNRLIGFKHFNNSDYVGPDLPFVKKGLAKTWNGINVFQLSNKILRKADAPNQATHVMWCRSAVGFGYVRELTGTVVWDNRKDCWTHNLRMRIGSKLLMEQGVALIRTTAVNTDVVITS